MGYKKHSAVKTTIQEILDKYAFDIYEFIQVYGSKHSYRHDIINKIGLKLLNIHQ